MPNKPYISRDDALRRLQRYCAYQDRCHQEVRRKLLDLGIYGDDLENIIAELITDNFLNEERFARSFARGKFQTKGWGRLRILQELKARQISAYCQRKALEEIPEMAYREKLEQVLQKKSRELDGEEPFKARQQLVQYALRRGYEMELILEAVDRKR